MNFAVQSARTDGFVVPHDDCPLDAGIEVVDIGKHIRKRDDLDAFATQRPLVGDKADDALGAAGPEMAMCGRPRFGKGCFDGYASWSGAAMCSACLRGTTTAGPNAIRGPGPN